MGKSIYTEMSLKYLLERERYRMVLSKIEDFYYRNGLSKSTVKFNHASIYKEFRRISHIPDFEERNYKVSDPNGILLLEIENADLSFDSSFYSDKTNYLVNLHKDIMPELLQVIRDKKLNEILNES